MLRRHQPLGLDHDRGKLLTDGKALGRELLDSERLVGLQPGHSDHEEFIEVACRNRKEPQPLEQWVTRVAGFLENPAIERQPAKLSVKVSSFGERRLNGRNGRFHRRFGNSLHQLITPGEDSGFLVQCMSPN